MIGKISKGAGFRGCVNYVLGKPDAKLLAAEGVLTDSIQTITDCFQSQRMMKPHIRQPVGHISLSYAPEDASRMTDEILVSLAKEYMQKMGIKETQYIIARHKDQKHPHVHIVFNRVDNNRRTISDRNDCYRNIKVCKELKEKYGLYFGKGKDRVRTHRLKGSDKTKYEIYHAVKNSLGKSNSWKQFISELSKQGIKTEFKYRGRSNVIQGLSFTKDGITFKASDIDRSFSYSKLDRQLKETNSHSQRSIRMATNGSHQPAMQHENTYNSGNDVVESIAGAFGGLFNPAPNYGDENAEAAFQRKLKRRKREESTGNHSKTDTKMKEMENNDFIHTLDAVYNLCSEIKERIVSVEITDEEESNDGIILLSDNLQRLQSEIAEMKVGLSSDKDGRDKLRAAINLRLKEINEVYSALSTTNERIFAGQERISKELQRIQSLKIQNDHTHVIDFKTSRPFLWQVVMAMIILLLLVGNVYQFKRNMDLSDNDLKYRLIKNVRWCF